MTLSKIEQIDIERQKTAKATARAAIAELKKNPNALVYTEGYDQQQIGKAIIEVVGPGLYSASTDGGRVLVTVRRQFALKK